MSRLLIFTSLPGKSGSLLTVGGWTILAILLVVTLQVSGAGACFAVIVGREASVDGSVLVGHNEENRGRQIVNFRRIPARQYDEGAEVSLHRGGTLPQVRRTAALLWSEIPGLEFSDAYLNEWGVAIVSDACPTREDDYETLVRAGEIRDGGIGYMLRRLVAERAQSARDGVRIAGQLMERFGYVHSGRTYVIADPGEAWLFAAVRGRHWVAQRVPDDGVVVLPNVHIIDRVDLGDADNFLGSSDLVEYAARRGWFDPNGKEPFSFSKAYAALGAPQIDPRRWQGQQLVRGIRDEAPPGEPLPFAVKPSSGRKLSVADVAAILRDRSGPIPLFKQDTQESAVFQLRAGLPAAIGCVWWRTTARPDVGVYTPWYLGITETPEGYYRPGRVEDVLHVDYHFAPPPDTWDHDPESAWWTFYGLQEWVDRDYRARAPAVQAEWREFERRLFARQDSLEKDLLELLENDPEAARALLTQSCKEISARARRTAHRRLATASR